MGKGLGDGDGWDDWAYWKGHEIGMLRVIRVTVPLTVGLLLLVLTGLIHQTRKQEDELRWMVICCEEGSVAEPGFALYLFEPLNGLHQRLTPYYDTSISDWFGHPHLIGIRDGWIYYTANSNVSDNQIGDLYRMRVISPTEALFGRPTERKVELLMEHTSALESPFSPDGKWLLVAQSKDWETHWQSIHLASGTTHDIMQGIRRIAPPHPLYVTGPIFSADGIWVYFQGLADDLMTHRVYRARLDGSAVEDIAEGVDDHIMLVGWIPDPEGLIIRQGLTSHLAFLNLTTFEWTPLGDWAGSATVPRLGNWTSSETVPQLVEGLNAAVWWLESGKVATISISAVRAYDVTTGQMLWEETGVLDWWPAPSGNLALFHKGQPWTIRSRDGSPAHPIDLPDNFSNLGTVHWVDDGTVFVEGQVSRGGGNVSGMQIWRVDIGQGKVTLLQERGSTTIVGWSPDNERIVVNEWSSQSDRLAWLKSTGGDYEYLTDGHWRLDGLEGWQTIDRPMNGNALAGIGVLLGAIGAGVMFWRVRKG